MTPGDLKDRPSTLSLWTTAPLLIFLATFTCSSFAAVAQGILWFRMYTLGFQEEPGFYSRLAIKAVLFAILALVSVAAIRWVSRRDSQDTPLEVSPKHPKKSSLLWLLSPLPLALILLVPNLEAYPWAAPDELHHLIVARNLAENGEYAPATRTSAIYVSTSTIQSARPLSCPSPPRSKPVAPRAFAAPASSRRRSALPCAGCPTSSSPRCSVRPPAWQASSSYSCHSARYTSAALSTEKYLRLPLFWPASSAGDAPSKPNTPHVWPW